MATIGNYTANYYLGRSLGGTYDNDYIYGHGGNDYIYGGGGTDVMYGGTGNDSIYAGSYDFWNYNADWGGTGVEYALGGAGNDFIDFRMTTHDFNLLYGDEYSAGSGDGADAIYGGFGIDYIYGGGGGDYVLDGGFGNDIIYGDFATDGSNDGNDVLVGGAGSDSLYGGGGNDILKGGTGGDWLTGGMGQNTFIFNQGDSGTTWASADTITDFYAPWDTISVSGPLGSASNYVEGLSYYKGFDYAQHVASYMIDHDTNYAFITDGTDGYLFADFDDNGVIDSGIELEGLASLSAFSYADIVW